MEHPQAQYKALEGLCDIKSQEAKGCEGGKGIQVSSPFWASGVGTMAWHGSGLSVTHGKRSVCILAILNR